MEINPKILIPGWAGELGADELEYIMEHLACSIELRRQWGIRTNRKGGLNNRAKTRIIKAARG